MDNSGCPSLDGCKAPLCPMDDSFENGAIWYVEEDICVSLKFSKEHWKRIQKRIKKLNVVYPVNGYFSIAMLKGLRVIRKGIHGCNPDVPLGGKKPVRV
jgi:hypothetical protein